MNKRAYCEGLLKAAAYKLDELDRELYLQKQAGVFSAGKKLISKLLGKGSGKASSDVISILGKLDAGKTLGVAGMRKAKTGIPGFIQKLMGNRPDYGKTLGAEGMRKAKTGLSGIIQKLRGKRPDYGKVISELGQVPQITNEEAAALARLMGKDTASIGAEGMRKAKTGISGVIQNILGKRPDYGKTISVDGMRKAKTGISGVIQKLRGNGPDYGKVISELGKLPQEQAIKVLGELDPGTTVGIGGAKASLLEKLMRLAKKHPGATGALGGAAGGAGGTAALARILDKDQD